MATLPKRGVHSVATRAKPPQGVDIEDIRVANPGSRPRPASFHQGHMVNGDRRRRLTDGEGGAAALVEYRDALAALSAQAEPDLAIALRLALRRDRLLGTEDGPGVDAAADRLTDAAWALARDGRPADAAELAAAAARVAAGIADPDRRADVLTATAWALALAGQDDDAERIAAGIDDPGRRAEALADVASALSERGDLDRAERIARGL